MRVTSMINVIANKVMRAEILYFAIFKLSEGDCKQFIVAIEWRYIDEPTQR